MTDKERKELKSLVETYFYKNGKPKRFINGIVRQRLKYLTDKAHRKFLVGIYYKTPSGRVGAKNYTVWADSIRNAQKKAEKKFWGGKGKEYSIQGGDATEIK